LTKLEKVYTLGITHENMKTLSLKLKETILEETEEILREKQIPRNRYINDALDFYNRYQKRKKLTNAFSKASLLVHESSLEVNNEFDRLIDEGAI
jgi:metal-responsive CopG/Arc/MetJ family transcriptional regulator